MPDIQEAKCFEFTVQIPPPLGAPRGGAKKFRANFAPPHRFISAYALRDDFKQGYNARKVISEVYASFVLQCTVSGR